MKPHLRRRHLLPSPYMQRPGKPEASLPIQSQKPAEKNHKGAQTTDVRTLDLLKKFPIYASLYIDVHGGTFAPDTPAVIRGEAVLYKNPYYDELKTHV